MSGWAVTIPLGLGGRILLARQRQTLVNFVTSLVPVAAWLFTLIGVTLARPSLPVLAAAIPLSLLCVSIPLYVLARRIVAAEGGSEAFEPEPTARLKRMAAPMAVLTLSLPLAYQSDRYVISLLSTPTELSRYSLAYLIYSAALSIVGAAGSALWPFFVKHRANGSQRNAYWQTFRIFAGLGVALAVAVYVLGPVVVRVVVSATPVIPPVTWAAFSALLLVFSLHWPSGGMLMDPAGLRFQAATSVLMVIANLALSCLLAPRIGAAGPILASTVSIIVFMAIPAFIRCQRILRREAREEGSHARELGAMAV
jgi:O-antigen/teichoic acid export membrane protein